METTRDNHSPYGRPMDRGREGHGGGGQLFAVRREAHLERGLLCEKGHNENYLIFRPSDLFVEVLGDDVLRFNEALFEFRGQVVKHLSVLGAEGLRGHYAELDWRVDVVRDRLLNLTDCCHKGFDGEFEKALDGVEPSEGEGLEKAGEDDADVFEGVRQRNVDEGILTELGRARGYVRVSVVPVVRSSCGGDHLHVERCLVAYARSDLFLLDGGRIGVCGDGGAVLRHVEKGYDGIARRTGRSG